MGLSLQKTYLVVGAQRPNPKKCEGLAHSVSISATPIQPKLR